MGLEQAYATVSEDFVSHAWHVNGIVDHALEDGVINAEDQQAVEALRALTAELACGAARWDSVFVRMFEQVEKDVATIDWALAPPAPGPSKPVCG